MAKYADKVFVSGATGFIGNYMTKKLARKHPDLQIYALSRSTPQTNKFKHARLASYPNVTFVQGNLLNTQTIPRDALSECGTAVHLVGGLSKGNLLYFISHRISKNETLRKAVLESKLSEKMVGPQVFAYLYFSLFDTISKYQETARDKQYDVIET